MRYAVGLADRKFYIRLWSYNENYYTNKLKKREPYVFWRLVSNVTRSLPYTMPSSVRILALIMQNLQDYRIYSSVYQARLVDFAVNLGTTRKIISKHSLYEENYGGSFCWERNKLCTGIQSIVSSANSSAELTVGWSDCYFFLHLKHFLHIWSKR